MTPTQAGGVTNAELSVMPYDESSNAIIAVDPAAYVPSSSLICWGESNTDSIEEAENVGGGGGGSGDCAALDGKGEAPVSALGVGVPCDVVSFCCQGRHTPSPMPAIRRMLTPTATGAIQRRPEAATGEGSAAFGGSRVVSARCIGSSLGAAGTAGRVGAIAAGIDVRSGSASARVTDAARLLACGRRGCWSTLSVGVYLEPRGVSTPLGKFTSVQLTMDAAATEHAFNRQVYELAEYCINQTGITHLHQITKPNDDGADSE